MLLKYQLDLTDTAMMTVINIFFFIFIVIYFFPLVLAPICCMTGWTGALVLYSEFHGDGEVGKVLFDLNMCDTGLLARLPPNKSGSEVWSG